MARKRTRGRTRGRGRTKKARTRRRRRSSCMMGGGPRGQPYGSKHNLGRASHAMGMKSQGGVKVLDQSKKGKKRSSRSSRERPIRSSRDQTRRRQSVVHVSKKPLAEANTNDMRFYR
jgi:hypothetical protein